MQTKELDMLIIHVGMELKKRLALSLVIGPLGSDKGSCATSTPFPRE
jgi:hypothetical protein